MLPEALVVDSRQAVLHARWRSEPALAFRSFQQLPELADVSAVDDRGVQGALRVEAMSSGPNLRGEMGWPMILRLGLDPVPARAARWIELRSGDGPSRLLPSGQAAMRVGRLTSAAADSIPASSPGWRAPSGPDDGPRCHLDLGGNLPPIDGVTVQADSLFSWAGHWRLYLRAMPGWWKYAQDRSRKWSPLSVMAFDDRGGRYASGFGGSAGHLGHEELALEFLPRLDPLARALTLIFRGAREEARATIDLESAGHEIRDYAG